MNIKVNRQKLHQAISEAASILPKKLSIAVLKYAKITTKGNRMKIEANDTQNSLVKYIDVIEADSEGSFLLELSEVNKLLAKLKCEEIDIKVDDAEVTIKYPRGSASYQTVNPAEYPSFDVDSQDMVSFSLPSSVLLKCIEKSKSFVSTDTLRPQLTAIYGSIEGKLFEYCATDTSKMITASYMMDVEEDLHINWYIMPTIFSLLAKACKINEIITIKVNESHAIYRAGDVIICSTLTKGNFPNYRRVIPDSWQIECSVNKSDVIDSLARVSLFNQETDCIKLDISHMDLNLSVDNYAKIKSICENIMHNGCNGEITLGLSAVNFTSCLKAFSSDEIVLHMTDSSRPIVFQSNQDEGIKVICMPMYLAR